MKNIIDKYFKEMALALQVLIFLLVFSMKLSTCAIENDIRTTKKNTKAIKEETITSDQLDQKLRQQKDSFLIQEKILDKQK